MSEEEAGEETAASEGADAMNVDMSKSSQAKSEPSLFGLLQKDMLQCEEERQKHQTNGNISGRVQKKTGALVNMLCAKLVIELQQPNNKKIMAPYYHCIACDKGRASNKQSRAFSHVDECNVCAAMCHSKLIY